ncbi:Guanine deaminase [Rosistilla carotiformis]|uniref:Guanine deaminase n=1 Tax=Rosistilla carotiformis TaxID=2528017 RepID=A0A518JV15_9BACT|nr:nucleoside deaminase [Rosistilla carotiformis]QDV69366.1 Guanine deaminase [Rosistilla carotiformis]
MLPLNISLPAWLSDQLAAEPTHFPSLEARMELVIRCSQQNFRKATGGPFAAGVFEKQSGRLVALGVNRVVPCHASIAHAEMVALTLAQQSLGTYDLGSADQPEHQLVVNGRPCAMCFGAIPWSGIRSLVIAASGDQIESITGFDEGPIHPDWQAELRRRGIEVIENILAAEASRGFQEFKESGGRIYNGRGDRPEI